MIEPVIQGDRDPIEAHCCHARGCGARILPSKVFCRDDELRADRRLAQKIALSGAALAEKGMAAMPHEFRMDVKAAIEQIDMRKKVSDGDR